MRRFTPSQSSGILEGFADLFSNIVRSPGADGFAGVSSLAFVDALFGLHFFRLRKKQEARPPLPPQRAGRAYARSEVHGTQSPVDMSGTSGTAFGGFKGSADSPDKTIRSKAAFGVASSPTGRTLLMRGPLSVDAFSRPSALKGFFFVRTSWLFSRSS